MAKDAGTVPAWEELGWRRYQWYRRHVMPGGEERDDGMSLPQCVLLVLCAVFLLQGAAAPEISLPERETPGAEVDAAAEPRGLPGTEAWQLDWYWLDEPYEFPLYPGTPEWDAITPRSTTMLLSVCQVPEDILYHLTTPALATTAAAYPAMSRGSHIRLTDWSQWEERVIGGSNAVRELMRRPEGTEAMARFVQWADYMVDTWQYDPERDRWTLERAESILAYLMGDPPFPGLRQPVPGGRAASLDGVGELVWPPRLRLGGAGRETA